jgi:hypothetical protein
LKDYIITESSKIILEFRLSSIASLRYSTLLKSLLKRLDSLERLLFEEQPCFTEEVECLSITRPKSNSKRSPKNYLLENLMINSPMISSVSSLSNINPVVEVNSPAFRGREGKKMRVELREVAR